MRQKVMNIIFVNLSVILFLHQTKRLGKFKYKCNFKKLILIEQLYMILYGRSLLVLLKVVKLEDLHKPKEHQKTWLVL